MPVDAERVRGGETKDMAVHRALGLARRPGEKQGNLRLVELARYALLREQRHDLRRESEDSGAAEVIERTHAEAVARTEECLCPPVPDRDREVADRVLGAIRPPASIGCPDQFGIRRAADWPKCTDEIVTVVDAGIGDDHEVAVAMHHGVGPGRTAVPFPMTLRERDAAAGPDAPKHTAMGEDVD